VDDFGLLFYNARWYDPALGRFAQADTIIPGAGNPQAWDRYSYARNNPIRYHDPSGHKPCEDIDSNGNCTGDKLARFLDYFDKEIVNEKGVIKAKYRDDILGAMTTVVKKAAYIFGKDWNGFFDATDYVFSGYYGHGAGTMWKAHRSDFQGYFDGDTGFNSDFRDNSNQVRHFWVALASAANPYGDNPLGGAVASIGNQFHDKFVDNSSARPSNTDGVSVMDYKLSITGIDIARQIGNEVKTPSDLANVLLDRLGTDGPGYIGPEVDPSTWFTPWY
jgi:RHS repeat-associated protein